MALDLNVNVSLPAFAGIIPGKKAAIAEAASTAIKGAGEQARTDGRAEIGAAGFSQIWEKAWQLRLYPEGKPSIGAAAFLVHKIPYANVFEEGAEIAGKPKLWLPFSSTPAKLGRKALTPALFVQQVGPLVTAPFKTRSGNPILAAPMAMSGPADRTVTFNKLRQGAGRPTRKGGGNTASRVATASRIRLQPLFFGLSAVQIRKKFNLVAACERAASTVAARFSAALKDT
jgi:hypothetical protein